MWSKKVELSSSFNSRRPNANANKALMQALARDRMFDLTGRTGAFVRPGMLAAAVVLLDYAAGWLLLNAACSLQLHSVCHVAERLVP
jgi:hypothetical protein